MASPCLDVSADYLRGVGERVLSSLQQMASAKQTFRF